MVNLTEYCAHCRNYFAPKMRRNGEYKHSGTFAVSGGTIEPLDFLLAGQYFRIVGSVLNDGVYCNAAEDLQRLSDETFTGEIWEMAVPKDFIAQCEAADEWRKLNEKADSTNMSPFTSESFGGYSYTKSGSNAENGSNATWQTVFEQSFRAWQRIYV